MTETEYVKTYCNNYRCEAEAVWFYIGVNGLPFFLCATCANAFELGQGNPDKSLEEADRLGG